MKKMDAKVHVKFEEVDTTSLKVNDKIKIYGQYLAIAKIHNRHIHNPVGHFQFIELTFSEFKECIRVPAGWVCRRQVETDYEMPTVVKCS